MFPVLVISQLTSETTATDGRQRRPSPHFEPVSAAAHHSNPCIEQSTDILSELIPGRGLGRLFADSGVPLLTGPEADPTVVQQANEAARLLDSETASEAFAAYEASLERLH